MILVHKRTGKSYEWITTATHAKTHEPLSLYRSMEWSTDYLTGEPIPPGTLWARNEKEVFQKFNWSVTEVEDKS